MQNLMPGGNFTRFLVIAIIVLASSGCAPNNLSIRLAYSRLDNNLSSRFNEYATFDDQQRAWIDSAASEYQKWHRKTELPDYAIYFNEVATILETGDPVDVDFVDGLFGSLESFSSRSFLHSPFSNSVPFLGKLTDTQVRQIESSFAKQNKQQLERIREQADLPDNSKRIDRITRRLAMVGLSLNHEQRAIIDKGMQQYVGSREDRVYVWKAWERKFIQLLDARDQPDFDNLMQNHIAQYQLQMELRYPERSAKNRKTAISTIVLLLNSLTPTQRTKLVSTLRDSGNVLFAMANSKQTDIL